MLENEFYGGKKEEKGKMSFMGGKRSQMYIVL